MRKCIGWSVLLVAMVMFVAMSASAEPTLNPGKWEMTSQVEMPGMPMKMPPMKFTQCMTKDDMIMKPPAQPGRTDGANIPCKVTHTETKGDTIIWDMVCDDQGEKMTYHGEIAYHGDTMEGFMKVIHAPGSQGKAMPPMTIKMKGKRIGPCDK